MRQDERTPLSRAKLQQQIIKENKFEFILPMIPMLFVTLLTVGITAWAGSFLAAASSFFRVVLVLCVLPFWVGDAVLIYRAWKAFRRYRGDLGRDFVVIETDTVNDLTEESELHRSGNMAYQDRAYVVYLEKHGRVVIDRTLWNILKMGDEVYVAVTMRAKKRVYRVYSTLTHRITEK